ncbi:serine/threonine kinase [Schistosoma mansoni]|uniref:serine/threonine kinase n=1 Tax=Schistosoma mansoni TaxID=6183 RepID=UPI0001A62E73|nr:serine/threonine kinase [Schistosoma mansoni]|eukprot:XP_018649367.1 serine/threonine kinase [Schistosoma mansoni]
MKVDTNKTNENKFKQWFNRTFKMSLKPPIRDTKSVPTTPSIIEDENRHILNYTIDSKALSMKAIAFRDKHCGLNEAPEFMGVLQSEYHIMPIQNKEISSNHGMIFVFEPILLYCYVQSTAQDVVFIWQKDSIEIKPSDRIDIFSQDTATQLRINCPNLSDNGDYDCIAMNPEGRCSTHTRIFIEVQEPDGKVTNPTLSDPRMEDNVNLHDIQKDSSEHDDTFSLVNDLKYSCNHILPQSPLRRIGFRRTVCYSKCLTETKENNTSNKIKDLFLKFNSVSECENIILLDDKHIGSRRYQENNRGWKYNSFRYLRNYDMNQANNFVQLLDSNKGNHNNNINDNVQNILSVKEQINSHYSHSTKSINSPVPKVSHTNSLYKDENIPVENSSTTSNMKSINEFLFTSNQLNVNHLSAAGSSISDIFLSSGRQSPKSKSSQISLNDIDFYPINNIKLIEVRMLNTSSKENPKTSISDVVQEIVMQYVGSSQNYHSSFSEEDLDYKCVNKTNSNNPEQIKPMVTGTICQSNENRISTKRTSQVLDSNKDNETVICKLSSSNDGNGDISEIQKQTSFSISDCDESGNQSVYECSKTTHNQATIKQSSLNISICNNLRADKIHFSKPSGSHDANKMLKDSSEGISQTLEKIPIEQPPTEPVKRRPNISSILIDKKLKSSRENIKDNLLVSPTEKTTTSDLLTEPYKRKIGEEYQYPEKVKRLTRSRKTIKEQHKPSNRENKFLNHELNDSTYPNDNLNVSATTFDVNKVDCDMISKLETSIQSSYSGIICTSKTINNRNSNHMTDALHPSSHEHGQMHQNKVYELMQKFEISSKTACLSPSKQIINRIPRINNENSTKPDDFIDKAFYNSIGVDKMITNQILNNSTAVSISTNQFQKTSRIKHHPLASSKYNNLEIDNNQCGVHLEQPIHQSTKHQSSNKNYDDLTHNLTNDQTIGITKSVNSTFTEKTFTQNITDGNMDSSKPNLKKYSAYTREEFIETQSKVIKREAYVNTKKITPEEKTSGLPTNTSENRLIRKTPLSKNPPLMNDTLKPSNVPSLKPVEQSNTPVSLLNKSISDHSNVKCTSGEKSPTSKSDQTESIDYPLKINTIKNVNPTDHYEEIAVLGYGTYGRVIKCLEKKTGNIFAAKKFKILRLKRYQGELMEVAVLRTIGKHPQIAHLHAAYEYNLHCTLITEFVPGGALYNRIEKEGSLDEAITVSIIRQILLGLKHLQDCSVIHRDLKPENLMMVQASGYRLKIIDFGLAVFYQSNQCTPIPAGTLTYIAPETQNCDPQSYTTDLWSVAVIAYEILAGITPFEIPQDGCRDRILTNQEISLNITHVRYDFDDPGIVDVSNEAKDFIKQILVRDPKKRPSVDQCLSHPWMAMREEDRPLVKRTVSLFRHSTRKKPKGYRIKTQTTQKYDPHNSADPEIIE